MDADGQGGAGSTGPGSRGGSPSGDVDRTDDLSAKPTGDTNSSFIDGERSAAVGQKRRLSNENSQAAVGGHSGDLDRDQPSWKNKKPHVNNNGSTSSNGNHFSNHQGINRNRPPSMHGPGSMGPMDPSMMDPHLMFPEGIPPGFFGEHLLHFRIIHLDGEALSSPLPAYGFRTLTINDRFFAIFLEMMQQHDPALFMDPNMFGPNGVPQFMMPGFVPPFMPEFGGMPGQGGPSGPEMWNMGRSIPGLPPMGPGFPTPRIGFSEPGAGRGRGRSGGWQESGQNGHVGPNAGRGRGYPQEFNQNGSHGIPASGGNSDAPFKPAGAGAGAGAGTTRATSASGDNAREANDHRNSSQDPQGRIDNDDIDMSQVPTGPRATRRYNNVWSMIFKYDISLNVFMD